MGRTKKNISTVQSDPILMKEIGDQLRKIGLSTFASNAKVDRVSIYNWLNGESVEPSTEDAILTAIEETAVDKAAQLHSLLAATIKARKKHVVCG